jgi:SMI1 / KNR4 family (SUKH-1)
MADTWIRDAIKYWKLDKIDLLLGADLSSISSLEKEVGVKLPTDFIEFYMIVNGFKNLSVNNNLFCIWPIEKIKEDYLVSNNKNFIAFCDYMIASQTIGLSKISDGVFNDFDIEKPVANTFKEFINFINSPLTDRRFVK